MRQKVFQLAKELGVDSKIIVRKLEHENLPPPARDRGEAGRQASWTPRSAVSVGLGEMIREWHGSGELLKVEMGEPVAARRGRKPRGSEASAGAAEDAAPTNASQDAGDDSVARQALDAVAEIEQEARQKKRAQLESLRESRVAIAREIKALERQIGQLDHALAVVAGRAAGTAPAQPVRTRRDLSELREQMGVWLESKRGEKFGAGALVQEFPDLGKTAVSYVLRPLVEAGRIQTDASAGSKRPTYFAP